MDFKQQYLETRNEQKKGYGSEFVLPSLKKQETFIHNPTANGFDTEVTWELSYDPIIIYKNNVFKSSEIQTDLQEVKNGYKKPVDLFDKNGNYLQTFESCTKCAEYLGVSNPAISNHFKGTSAFVMGHTIKYSKSLN